MNAESFQLSRVSSVMAGPGALDGAIDALRDVDARRVAVVTSPSVGRTASVRRLLEQLGDAVVLVDDETRPHPSAEGGADLIRRVRATDADALLAIGGGSAIDRAKFAALGVTHGVDTADGLLARCVRFEYPDGVHVPELEAEPLPIIAAPTTLSAAEWNGFGGVVDADTGVKHTISHLELTPRVVILDQTLAASTPRALWATTGARAIDHAVETLYGSRASDFTDVLALGALRLLGTWLPRSVADPDDAEAARHCQWAAGMSIMGVHNVSLGLSHGIGHQLGARGVPHGVTSCITLPHVMRFMLSATTPQQASIAAALGAGAVAEDAAGAVEALFDELGVRTRLRDAGIARAELPAIASATMTDVVTGASPIAISADDVLAILHQAW